MIDTTDIEDGPQGNGAYRRLLEEISRGYTHIHP